MRMTKENKIWMAHALYLGEDNMHLFGEKCWEWISEPMDSLPLNEQCMFYQAYVKLGGKDDKTYDNEEALDKAIVYAESRIEECFAQIEQRFKLGGD